MSSTVRTRRFTIQFASFLILAIATACSRILYLYSPVDDERARAEDEADRLREEEATSVGLLARSAAQARIHELIKADADSRALEVEMTSAIELRLKLQLEELRRRRQERERMQEKEGVSNLQNPQREFEGQSRAFQFEAQKRNFGTEQAAKARKSQLNAANNRPAIKVYFATDRAVKGDARRASSYGVPQGAEVKFGVCSISIPPFHRLGELESPFLSSLPVLGDLEWFEDPTRHIAIIDIDPLESSAFFGHLRQTLTQSKVRDVLVFVHGYRVSFREACRRTGQLAHDLRFPGAPVMYSWPSLGTFLGYTQDADAVRGSIAQFESFLDALITETRSERIHLIAHSMGSRVLVQALSDLQRRHARKVFNQIVFAAPDISAQEFRSLASRFSQAAERTTLYASSKDSALVTARRLVWGYTRAGEAGEDLLVLDGIDTIDASNVDTSFVGHSYYGGNRSVIGDLRDLILFRRGPEQRPSLTSATKRNRVYWLFPP